MTTINKITHEDVDNIVSVQAHGKFTLDDYQVTAVRSAIYPGSGTPLGLIYCTLKLNGEAGELAEHVGKSMRDDDLTVPFEEAATEDQPRQHYFGYTELTPKRRDLIIKELGDCLWYLAALSNELGLSLGDVALMNLRKLADRTERNALRGAGDER